MNGIIFDIVLVGIIVISVFVGKKRGLLATVFSAGIILIAVILANVTAPYIAKGMEKMQISDKINTKIYDTVNNLIEEEDMNFEELTSKYYLPESVTKTIEEKAEDIKTATGKALAQKIADKLTEIAIKILSFVIVALVVVVLLIAISIALKVLSKLPVIEKFDKAGGGIAGFVFGLACVFVVCMIIYFVGLSNVGGTCYEIASTSYAMKLVDKIGIMKGIIG